MGTGKFAKRLALKSAIRFFAVTLVAATMACTSEKMSGEVSLAAGGEIGNGGDAVVCRDAGGAILSMDLYDYYEAGVMRGWHPDLGAPTLPWEEKVELALKRIDYISPQRAELYRKIAAAIPSEITWEQGPLPDVPDQGETLIPDGCRIEQAVLQKVDVYRGFKREFRFDKTLWDQMNNDARAGLILHEIFYHETLRIRHAFSVSARYVNSLVASGKVNDLSAEQFQKLMSDLRFPYGEQDGFFFSRWGNSAYYDQCARPSCFKEIATFWANGKLHLFTPVPESMIIVEGQRVEANNSISLFENGDVENLTLKYNSPLKFFKSIFGQRIQLRSVEYVSPGRLKHLNFIGTLRVPMVGGAEVELIREAEFYASGSLKEGTLINDLPMNGSYFRALFQGCNSLGSCDQYQYKARVKFHETGVPAEGYLKSGEVLLGTEWVRLVAERHQFHPNGRYSRGNVMDPFKIDIQRLLALIQAGPVELHKNGVLKFGVLSAVIKVKIQDKSAKIFDNVTLKESGELERVTAADSIKVTFGPYGYKVKATKWAVLYLGDIYSTSCYESWDSQSTQKGKCKYDR